MGYNASEESRKYYVKQWKKTASGFLAMLIIGCILLVIAIVCFVRDAMAVKKTGSLGINTALGALILSIALPLIIVGAIVYAKTIKLMKENVTQCYGPEPKKEKKDDEPSKPSYGHSKRSTLEPYK